MNFHLSGSNRKGNRAPHSKKHPTHSDLPNNQNNSAALGGRFWVVAPHLRNGPYRQGKSTFLWFNRLTTPKDLGAEGGNLALLDGSVNWKKLRNMSNDHWTFLYDSLHRGYW
jgi:hypothetical protein